VSRVEGEIAGLAGDERNGDAIGIAAAMDGAQQGAAQVVTASARVDTEEVDVPVWLGHRLAEDRVSRGEHPVQGGSGEVPDCRPHRLATPIRPDSV
jgi:hypothetical protein